MRKNGLCALAVIPLFLATACETEPQTGGGTEFDVPPPTDIDREDLQTEGDQGIGAEEYVVRLGPLEEASLFAEARLTRIDTGTEIVLQVEDGPESSELPAALHRGTCLDPGGAVEPLSSVDTDEFGSGLINTVVAISIDDILEDGEHIVWLEDADGQPLACGELSEEEVLD